MFIQFQSRTYISLHCQATACMDAVFLRFPLVNDIFRIVICQLIVAESKQRHVTGICFLCILIQLGCHVNNVVWMRIIDVDNLNIIVLCHMKDVGQMRIINRMYRVIIT